MSAAEQIEWSSEHPAYLRSLHPCEDLGDDYDTDFPNPANDNGRRLVALATSFPEQPNGAATNYDPILPLARGATASTRQGRGGLFRSEARTETGRGLTPIKEAKDDGGNSSFTVYVFESLELRRTQYDSGFADDESGTDYEVSHYTVVPYLLANGVRMARLVYHAPEAVPEEDYKPHGAPGDVNGFTPQAPAVSEGKLHVFFELGDHLGSTSVVLDKATGELVERATFQGYGGAESDYRPDRWKSFREDYRFTGKEEDVEVGLQYFGKRYLNPLLGRWVSADPLAVHAPGEADLNVYAYVSGHILKNTDPLGLCKDSEPCSQDPSANADGQDAESIDPETGLPNYAIMDDNSYNMEAAFQGDEKSRQASEAKYKEMVTEPEFKAQMSAVKAKLDKLIAASEPNWLERNAADVSPETMEALGQVQKGAIGMSIGAGIVIAGPAMLGALGLKGGLAAGTVNTFGIAYSASSVGQVYGGGEVSLQYSTGTAAIAAGGYMLMGAPIVAAAATESTVAGNLALNFLGGATTGVTTLTTQAVMDGKISPDSAVFSSMLGFGKPVLGGSEAGEAAMDVAGEVIESALDTNLTNK